MIAFSPKLIGSGSYGFIHHPALQYDTLEEEDQDDIRIAKDPTRYVSKLMIKKEAEEEMAKYRLLAVADPDGEFHLGLPKMVKPHVSACRFIAKHYKKSYIDVLTNLEKWRLLIMPHGGMSVAKYVDSVEERYDPSDDSRRDAIKELWIEMLRMIYAVSSLLDSGLVHHDFKHYNILYDRHARRANLIDFSFLNKMDVLKEQTRKTGDDAYEWNLFFFNLPPEIVFYNKTDFETVLSYSHEDCEAFFNSVYLEDRFFGTEPTKKKEQRGSTEPVSISPESKETNSIGVRFGESTPKARNRLFTTEERESFLNNLFFLVDQYEVTLEEIEKMAEEPVKMRDYMIAGYRQFVFTDVTNYTHDEFVDQSLKTFDIFGLGSCFLHILVRTYRFVPREFVCDMYRLIRCMLDANLYTRIHIDMLLTTYFDILRRHWGFGADFVVEATATATTTTASV